MIKFSRTISIRLLLALSLCLTLFSATAADTVPYLQIGVFSNKTAAKDVVRQLEKQGFDVYQQKVDMVGRPAIVVLVGPYERSSQARYDQNRLREKGWPAAIKRYPELPKPKPSTFRASVSGLISAEVRSFPDDALYSSEQHDTTASLVLQPEFYMSWNDRKSSFTFVPFVRGGDEDDERNHADIRELLFINAMGDWELRLGVGKVFWGVAESLHIVDVINQVDLVENLDGEDKLGQPMVNVSWFTDWGTWDVFALPMFRERTFPGEKGRLRGPLVIDTEQDALYESEDKDENVDWAIRWSHYIGDWDIGLSHFSGTSREPEFVPGLNSLGQAVLVPRYNLIDQTGLTVQAILADWLLKLEATSTKEKEERYTEAVAGFEYTHVGLFGSAVDLGFVVEYLYDERDELATSTFEDDVMVGLRWVFNDMQSTEILMGAIYDLDGTATSSSIEASRRLGQSWKLALEYRGSHDVDPTELGYALRNDNYVQIEIGYHF